MIAEFNATKTYGQLIYQIVSADEKIPHDMAVDVLIDAAKENLPTGTRFEILGWLRDAPRSWDFAWNYRPEFNEGDWKEFGVQFPISKENGIHRDGFVYILGRYIA